jgi:hypothetical protein
MGCKWKPLDPTIHIYCKILWEHKYRTKYQKICEQFLSLLYKFIFYAMTPCMTDKEIVVIRRIENWYFMENGTYIRVFDTMNPPHLLPQFVPDKLLLQEITHQTIIHGVGGILYQGKK